MDRAEAENVISRSLKKGTSSPFVGVPDRDLAVSEAGEKLVQSVIDPYPVSVVAASFDEYDYRAFSSGKVFAIAGDGNHVLLYNPELQLFALGWGNDPSSFTMLGFATDDALAEWRG